MNDIQKTTNNTNQTFKAFIIFNAAANVYSNTDFTYNYLPMHIHAAVFIVVHVVKYITIFFYCIIINFQTTDSIRMRIEPNRMNRENHYNAE